MRSAADPHAAEFEAHREVLMGVAYRMLGSVSDAEDIVQDAWLRWREARAVESPRGWLVRVVSRLCLDRLKSARVKREHYFGTWLPEPLVERAGVENGARGDEVDESVSIALMLVLEKLSPAERAGFLLHEVFGYDFAEIADILEKNEAACRKLVSRARARVRAERPRFATSHAEHEELMRRFLTACRGGDIEPLLALFGEEVALYSDGGGKAPAVPKVLTDREVIAKFFVGVVRNLEAEDHEIRPTRFNGAPGVLFVVEGKIVSALSLDVREGRIAAIYGHRNPDKLRAFAEARG
jgi:RNA polymerase sigma-70 factor, TIGR02957 family